MTNESAICLLRGHRCLYLFCFDGTYNPVHKMVHYRRYRNGRDFVFGSASGGNVQPDNVVLSWRSDHPGNGLP